MQEPGDNPVPADHTRCRNFVWEPDPTGPSPVPGRYCENVLGVFHHLDCPALQGRRCLFYEARAAGETPIAATAERLVELRERLSEDFLRWPYDRRREKLADPVHPPEIPATRSGWQERSSLARRAARRRRHHPPRR